MKKVTGRTDLAHVFSIRRQVFVEEQKIQIEIEHVAEDESSHFLALVDGEPAGAARWRMTQEGYKLERFAVLQRFRKMGVGEQLLKKILKSLPNDGHPAYAHAQSSAVSFYEKFHFERTGSEFQAAGISHCLMILKRSPPN